MNFTRSDTFFFKFQRKDSEGKIITVKADEVWFTVKKNANTKNKEIQKTLTDGTIRYDESDNSYHIVIKPEDTCNLAYNHDYFFDIQIFQSNYQKTIAKGVFKVDEEATFEIIVSPDSSVVISSENPEATIDVEQENAIYIVMGEDAYPEHIIEEFNENAKEKTDEFNQNAISKTDDFNQNVESKLSDLNSNYDSAIEDFNNNAASKTEAFNQNAMTQTSSFNENASQKTEEFNENASGYVKKSETSAVATSGSYNDLIDKPTIPEATVVVDNLTSTSATDALSANQGRVLNEKISDISGSIDNEINAIKADVESNTADINEINGRIDELEDNVFDVGEATGSELYITDSINHDFLTLSIDGKSEQETTEGYQLLPYPYEETTKTVNGITFTDNGDGTVTVNGTSTSTATFRLYGYSTNLKEIPGNYISGGTSDIFVRVVTYDNGQYHVLANSTGNADEIDKSTYQNGYIEIAISPNTTLNNQLIKPLLSNITDATFEKYTGGLPSPNPEYPSEIKNVHGITNYLNLNDIEETTVNGVTYSCKNGELNLNGIATGPVLIDFETTDIKEGTYYFSSTITNATGSYARYVRNEAGDNNLTNSGAITYSTNDKVYFRFYANSGSTFDNSIVKAKLNDSEDEDYSLYGSWLGIVSDSKNMFNITDGSGTRLGVEVRLNKSSIIFNGTSTSSGNLFPNEFEYVNLGKFKAGTYTFSSKIVNGSVTGGSVSEAFYLRKNGNTPIFNFGFKNNPQFTNSFILNEDCELFTQYYINGAGLIYDNLIIDVQLENGSIATDSEVHKENNVLIDMNKTNLANYSTIEKYNRDLSTAPTVGSNFSYVDTTKALQFYIPVAEYKGENLILIVDQKYSYLRVFEADEEYNYLSNFSSSSENGYVTGVIDENTKYLNVIVCTNFDSSLREDISVDEDVGLKLYKSLNTDDYYNVCSIGEVKDDLYIQFNENDKQYHAYLRKNIESVILDGSENWQGGADASTSGYKYFYCTKFTDVPVSYDIMCDKLNPYIDGALGSGIAVTTSTVGLNFSENNNLRVILDKSLLEDVSTGTNALNSFKNWLSQNKPEVHYILASPYTIDLGPVNMLKSYKNTTNVSTNDDLEPTINASYYKDFKVSISDLISRVSSLENVE